MIAENTGMNWFEIDKRVISICFSLISWF